MFVQEVCLYWDCTYSANQNQVLFLSDLPFCVISGAAYNLSVNVLTSLLFPSIPSHYPNAFVFSQYLPCVHAQQGVKQSACLSVRGPKNIENTNNQLKYTVIHSEKGAIRNSI